MNLNEKQFTCNLAGRNGKPTYVAEASDLGLGVGRFPFEIDLHPHAVGRLDRVRVFSYLGKECNDGDLLLMRYATEDFQMYLEILND